jgi:repressor LexA
MLAIKGDSMIEAGILDGDLVVVRQQQTADNGEIVVALLGEEATVKRYYKEKNRVRLQPENQALEPIYTNDLQLLGKVTGLLRKIH